MLHYKSMIFVKLISMSGYKSISKARLFFISRNYISNDLFIPKISPLFIEATSLSFRPIDSVS